MLKQVPRPPVSYSFERLRFLYYRPPISSVRPILSSLSLSPFGPPVVSGARFAAIVENRPFAAATTEAATAAQQGQVEGRETGMELTDSAAGRERERERESGCYGTRHRSRPTARWLEIMVELLDELMVGLVIRFQDYDLLKRVYPSAESKFKRQE